MLVSIPVSGDIVHKGKAKTAKFMNEHRILFSERKNPALTALPS